MKTKIILAYPPYIQYAGYGQPKRWLPLGITYIGACLESFFKKEIADGDLEVILLDLFGCNFGTSVDIIKNIVNPGEKILVGFTCMTEQRMSVFIMARLLKLAIPGIQIAVGGPHATLMHEQIIKTYYMYIDYIVLGEGEESFKELVMVSIDFSKGHVFNAIPGIVTASNPNPEKRMPIDNISTLPHAINGVKLFKNIGRLEAEAPMIFSRGCTASCAFCSTTKFWKGYRSRTAEDVFSEMLEWHYLYGANGFKFHDDASTANVEEWKKLCRIMVENWTSKALIKAGIWKYEITARADQMDDELIELLARSGCKRIAFGIETGSEAMLKAMNKRLDMSVAINTLKKVREKGIEVVGLFVIGFPGESEETINRTCELIRNAKPDVVCASPLMVFPGTKVYADCVKSGWIDDSYWLKDKPQPYYTQEQPMEKLNEWANKVTGATLCVNYRYMYRRWIQHTELSRIVISSRYKSIYRMDRMRSLPLRSMIASD
jgi:radical SAM superfamily enzyme YgiQ (UPF0313 family)